MRDVTCDRCGIDHAARRAARLTALRDTYVTKAKQYTVAPKGREGSPA